MQNPILILIIFNWYLSSFHLYGIPKHKSHYVLTIGQLSCKINIDSKNKTEVISPKTISLASLKNKSKGGKMKDNTGHKLTQSELAAVIKTKALAQSYIENGVPIHDWDNDGAPKMFIIPEPEPHTISRNNHTRRAQGHATPTAKPITELEYRDLAKMFAKALPINGQEYSDKVEAYLVAIKALPIEAKNALRAAYIFGSKAPQEEREDLFQDLALACLKAKTKDMKLAYAIARCDWMDWWSKYKIRQHTSLDSVVEDDEGNAVTLAELLVGETEFEAKMDGQLDGERIWHKLPADIKPLVAKRLMGKALTGSERVKMSRFVHHQGISLLLA